MIIGYERYAELDRDYTKDYKPREQDVALKAARCELVFTDRPGPDEDARPALAQVLDRLGPGDVLIAYKLDRIGRSVSEAIDVLLAVLERGANFRVLEDGLDSKSSDGPLIRKMLTSLRRYEQSLSDERRHRVLRQGPGRPLAVSGESIRDADRRIRNGESRAAVAKALGISRSTLHRRLAKLRPKPRREKEPN